MRLALRGKSGTRRIEVPNDLTLLDFLEQQAAEEGLVLDGLDVLCGVPRPTPLALPARAEWSSTPLSTLLSNGDVVVLRGTSAAESVAVATNDDATVPISAPSSSASLSGPSEAPRPPTSSLSPISVPVHTATLDGVLLRRTMENDNSCLFNAIHYSVNGRGRTGTEESVRKMRQLVADTVREDPTEYNEGVLEGKTPDDYAAWILDPKHWGGSVELSILAKHFRTEIAAVEVRAGRVLVFGEGSNFSTRVYVIFDGLHYDSVVVTPAEGMPEEVDICKFEPGDSRVEAATVELAKREMAAGRYTDVGTIALVCKDCGAHIDGPKAAKAHCEKTGHKSFDQR